MNTVYDTLDLSKYNEYEQETLITADELIYESVFDIYVKDAFKFNEYLFTENNGLFIQIDDIIAYFKQSSKGVFCYTANKDSDDLTRYEIQLLTEFNYYD